MTKVLIHDLPSTTKELEQRLRATLTNMEQRQATSLLGRLVMTDRRVPRLVLTGYFSSGKSQLIKALTDGAADVLIDADIATDCVTEYDWDGAVVLVDTPGVKAGVREHDELAEGALTAADLVLFVVPGDLFDDTCIRLLRHVADDLGKLDQMLIVISKTGTLAAASGVRQTAADEALGGGRRAALLECDAKDYLTGRAHQNVARGLEYVATSGIDELRAAINGLSERSGQLALDRQPLQLIKALAMEAAGLLAEDPEERAAMSLLARQRATLATRRQRIEAQASGLESSFTTRSIQAAASFVDSVEALEDGESSKDQTDAGVAAATKRLHTALGLAAEALGTGLQRMLELQFDDLTSEVREIEAGPHAKLILGIRSPAQYPTPAHDAINVELSPNPRSAAGRRSALEWIPDAQSWMKSFSTYWGAGGGLKASSGTAGHDAVKNIGHLFGKKFKPWEAVKAADSVGKAVKFASGGLSVAFALGGVLIEDHARNAVEKARRARRAAMVDEITAQADQIANRSIAQVRSHLDPIFHDAYSQIDQVYNEIVATQTTRSTIGAELADISRVAEGRLGQTGG